MKKLLFLLLFPLWVQAQNVTMNKTNGYLRTLVSGTATDSVMMSFGTGVNGYIPIYNSTLKKNVYTNPSTIVPTISFGTFGGTPNAQGGSYSGGVITLQPASLTHPGGVTIGEQYFSGQKRFYASGSGHIGLNSTSTPRLSLINSLYDLNIGNNGDEINFKYNSYDFILKPASHPASNLTLNLPASSGTLLLDNGSGSGLSGVMLLTGNQSASGNKTFTGFIEAAGVLSNNQLNVISGGAAITGNTIVQSGTFRASQNSATEASVSAENTSTGDATLYAERNTTAPKALTKYRTAAVLQWSTGLDAGSNSYVIQNNTGSVNAISIDKSTNAITATGSISSTPQGALYGTATGSITSAQLSTSLTDETGTGSAVFATSPTLTTPTLSGAVSATGQLTLGAAAGTLRIGTNSGDHTILSYSGGATSLNTNWASTSAILNLYANSVGFQVSGTGNATLTGTLTQGVSDKRFKKNIKIIPNALQKINSINGYTYEYDLENPDLAYIPKEGVDIGVIAQEIETAIPQAVSLAPIDRNKEGKSKSGKNYLTVNYEKIIPLLIQGIKEQQAIIKKQDARILELEKLYLELKK